MPKTEATDALPDILAQARSDYDRGYLKEQDNIKLAYEDLAFLAGDQWTKEDKDKRSGRPTLTVNRLPQFVHQITGDIRQMKPAIKVVPVDSGADEKIADLRAGLIRYIENRSDASAIYFRAADSQVACGIGHGRVATEYSDQTFNQEIRVAPIEDGVSVIWDPDSVLPSREDAEFCHVPVDMSRKAFEKKYPDKIPSDVGENWSHYPNWVSDDYVRISEYWVKQPTKKLLALDKDGSIYDLTGADEAKIAEHKAKGCRIETRDSVKIVRYLITATDILEGPKDWPGPDIPIVPFIGEEIRIGRNLIRNGIVRHAKDPQRMSNYFHSAHSETVALQPKAPFMVTETNVAKYQDLWNRVNDENLPYLVYTADSQNSGAQPQRVQPPVSSQGVLDGLKMAGEDMKAVIGIYDSSLGAKSNEVSGKAILARQKEGDTGSYLYIDNFARSIRRFGQIINNLIPFIYDTERTIRIMGEDGKIDVLEINKTKGVNPETNDTEYENDLTVGAYDVVAQMGPSYTTRREEAKEGMTNFVQAAPEAGSMILDLVAKAQDWPMANDISKRMRAMLPPKIIQLEEMEKQGATPEQIDQFLTQQQAPPPDPHLLKIQADAQAKQQQLQLDAQAEQGKQQLAQQQQMSDMRLEVQRMAFEQQQSRAEMQAAFDKAILDAQTKIEIAQIQAQVGVHKNVLDATARNNEMQTDAALRLHDIKTGAQTAQYATDSKAAQTSDGAEPAESETPELPMAPQPIDEVLSLLKQVLTDVDAIKTEITAPISIGYDKGRPSVVKKGSRVMNVMHGQGGRITGLN